MQVFRKPKKKFKVNDKKQVERYLRQYCQDLPDNVICALIANDYSKVYDFVNKAVEIEFLCYYYDILLNE